MVQLMRDWKFDVVNRDGFAVRMGHVYTGVRNHVRYVPAHEIIETLYMMRIDGDIWVILGQPNN